MIVIRRLINAAVIGTCLLACTVLSVPAYVLATTGPTHYLPPARYKVVSQMQKLYIGRYTVSKAASGARIAGGMMGIEVNSHGYLDGVTQFYGYDQAGHQSTWVGTLYNFRLLTGQKMSFEVLGPPGNRVLARVTVTRAKSGDLSGQITLSRGTWAISWHKLAR